MNFGKALKALKAGKCVTRPKHDKSSFIYLTFGSTAYVENSLEYTHIEAIKNNLFKTGDIGTVTRLPNLNMKLVSGVTMTGWTPTQADMLAEDWQELNHG